MTEARAVNREGRRVASFKPEVIMESVKCYLSLARSDLSALIAVVLGMGEAMAV
ncbi:hypothetical protein [Arthrobacter sp. H14-L1]|uniref:hypothetical protein n=1 Tax=Arthrobacter sp. H14-L1 TaxID=2996697 RepID=UPI002271FD06|nr:hypothetical protein [Arthrobacter sp. H14-L1]MCY0903680.1 hypothetical protein [Arthrobacter sp. H14-L1]